jgi:hypothetical protein
MKSLKLSPEEGFVLSRVDGSISVKELVALTGLEEGRIVDIVGRLRTQGALEVDGEAPPEVATESDVDAELQAFLRDMEGRQGEPSPEELSATADADQESSGDEGDEGGEGGEGETETEDELVQREQQNEADYRKLFMTLYASESRDFRAKAALEASGSNLLALCFDPDPQIIHAVLTNPQAGLNHARMIAFHHRTQAGLESVAKRTDYLKDSLVQRRLLRNPQLPTTILNRIMNPRMLSDVYKSAIDREIPERTRTMTREILRKKFMLASSDEKAALLHRTEGRCLLLLVACTLDAHATTILCSKTNFTILFIQNLARWSATPPALLAHLLKLQVVRRNIGLAKMVLKHPNTPSEAKRSFIR